MVLIFFSNHRQIKWQLLATYDPHGSGKFGKCMEQFSVDPHGSGKFRKCIVTWMWLIRAMQEQLPRSNFQSTHMARIVPTILLHLLHPWRSDVGSSEVAMKYPGSFLFLFFYFVTDKQSSGQWSRSSFLQTHSLTWDFIPHIITQWEYIPHDKFLNS